MTDLPTVWPQLTSNMETTYMLQGEAYHAADRHL